MSTGYPPVPVPFQVTPRPDQYAPGLPQTPHPGGMPVALADGSVRVLSGSIDPTVFWGAVTPASGEILDGW